MLVITVDTERDVNSQRPFFFPILTHALFNLTFEYMHVNDLRKL